MRFPVLTACASSALCALLAGAAPAADAASQSPPPVTVVMAGHLIDVAAGKVRDNQAIVIEGGVIKAVAPASATVVPAGAKVIDLSRQTVLPGLIDAHVHITSDPTTPPYHDYGVSVPRRALQGARFARDTLLAGVTTVRNVGSSDFTDVALRDAINAGDVIGPRLLVSGPMIGMTGGHCDDNMLAPEYKERADGVADGPDAVRAMVRRNEKYGVDMIKYCGTGGVFSKGDTPGGQQYTPEEVAALVNEAHLGGRRVAVHAHGADGIKVALRAGVDTVEHASLIDEEGLDLAKKNGTYLCMDIYNSEYTQAEGPKRGELEEFLQKDRDIAEIQRQNFRKAVQKGIRLPLATDAGVHRHGDNPQQLAWMVRYGMTPMQAIQSSTRVSAEALGIDRTVGQVAPGFAADLIAVPADPLADVSVLEHVAFVMKQGVVYKQ